MRVLCQNSAAQVWPDCLKKHINMAHTSACHEMLEAQQQAIASLVESIEKEISTNSDLMQTLLEQPSSAASKSLKEQVEDIIAKEKENVPKLQALEDIQCE